MADKLSNDVEQLKASMASMKDGQDEIKKSINDIAKVLGELLIVRKHQEHQDEVIERNRISSHKHENMLQQHEMKLLEHDKDVAKLFISDEKLAENEKNLEMKQAKNGVVIALVTSVLVVILTTAIKGVFH